MQKIFPACQIVEITPRHHQRDAAFILARMCAADAAAGEWSRRVFSAEARAREQAARLRGNGLGDA